MTDIHLRGRWQPLGGCEILVEAAGLKNVQTLFNLEATALDRCSPTGRPSRKQVTVAFYAVGPRGISVQRGGTRGPVARTSFTPIGLATVAHATASSPRISTVT